MHKIFSIQQSKDILIFRCLKDIEICLSLKEIIKENTTNGLISISGCVEDTFYKILNHKEIRLADGTFKELFENDKGKICDKIAKVYFEYI